jgi:hypothetical protein
MKHRHRYRTAHGINGLESDRNAAIMNEADKERLEAELVQAKSRLANMEALEDTRTAAAQQRVTFLQDELLKYYDIDKWEHSGNSSILVPKKI